MRRTARSRSASTRSEEHTSELQSPCNLVCRLLLEKKLASIKRYLKQRRETGELSPKAIPGRPSKKYAALEAGLVAQLKAHPDSTLEGHCQLWESTHGMWVDHTTMSRAIRRVGWTRKKN